MEMNSPTLNRVLVPARTYNFFSVMPSGGKSKIATLVASVNVPIDVYSKLVSLQLSTADAIGSYSNGGQASKEIIACMGNFNKERDIIRKIADKYNSASDKMDNFVDSQSVVMMNEEGITKEKKLLDLPSVVKDYDRYKPTFEFDATIRVLSDYIERESRPESVWIKDTDIFPNLKVTHGKDVVMKEEEVTEISDICRYYTIESIPGCTCFTSQNSDNSSEVIRVITPQRTYSVSASEFDKLKFDDGFSFISSVLNNVNGKMEHSWSKSNEIIKISTDKHESIVVQQGKFVIPDDAESLTIAYVYDDLQQEKTFIFRDLKNNSINYGQLKALGATFKKSKSPNKGKKAGGDFDEQTKFNFFRRYDDNPDVVDVINSLETALPRVLSPLTTKEIAALVANLLQCNDHNAFAPGKVVTIPKLLADRGRDYLISLLAHIMTVGYTRIGVCDDYATEVDNEPSPFFYITLIPGRDDFREVLTSLDTLVIVDKGIHTLDRVFVQVTDPGTLPISTATLYDSKDCVACDILPTWADYFQDHSYDLLNTAKIGLSDIEKVFSVTKYRLGDNKKESGPRVDVNIQPHMSASHLPCWYDNAYIDNVTTIMMEKAKSYGKGGVANDIAISLGSLVSQDIVMLNNVPLYDSVEQKGQFTRALAFTSTYGSCLRGSCSDDVSRSVGSILLGTMGNNMTSAIKRFFNNLTFIAKNYLSDYKEHTELFSGVTLKDKSSFDNHSGNVIDMSLKGVKGLNVWPFVLSTFERGSARTLTCGRSIQDQKRSKAVFQAISLPIGDKAAIAISAARNHRDSGSFDGISVKYGESIDKHSLKLFDATFESFHALMSRVYFYLGSILSPNNTTSSTSYTVRGYHSSLCDGPILLDWFKELDDLNWGCSTIYRMSSTTAINSMLKRSNQRIKDFETLPMAFDIIQSVMMGKDDDLKLLALLYHSINPMLLQKDIGNRETVMMTWSEELQLADEILGDDNIPDMLLSKAKECGVTWKDVLYPTVFRDKVSDRYEFAKYLLIIVAHICGTFPHIVRETNDYGDEDLCCIWSDAIKQDGYYKYSSGDPRVYKSTFSPSVLLNKFDGVGIANLYGDMNKKGEKTPILEMTFDILSWFRFSVLQNANTKEVNRYDRYDK